MINKFMNSLDRITNAVSIHNIVTVYHNTFLYIIIHIHSYRAGTTAILYTKYTLSVYNYNLACCDKILQPHIYFIHSLLKIILTL